MKNEQLMTLNKVLHNGQVKTVDSICRSAVTFVEDIPSPDKYGEWVDLDEIEFMPFTTDILDELGFINERARLSTIEFRHKLGVSFTTGDLWIKYRGNFMYNIKYAHQIQNLLTIITH